MSFDRDRRLSASPVIEPLVDDLPLADSCCKPRGIFLVENLDNSKTVPGTSSVSVSARMPNVHFRRAFFLLPLLLSVEFPSEAFSFGLGTGPIRDPICWLSDGEAGFGVVGFMLVSQVEGSGGVGIRGRSSFEVYDYQDVVSTISQSHQEKEFINTKANSPITG